MAVIPIGMPTSNVIMSVGAFIILGAWLLETDWKNKWICLKSNPFSWLVLGLFLIHLLGLIYSDNLKYALNDIRIKLPLFIFPIVMASMPAVSDYYKKIILLLFISTVLMSTFISFNFYLFHYNPAIDDVRNISKFVSHIRFGLMLVIAILFLVYMMVKNTNSKFLTLVYLAIILWFIYFLYILQSLTGWICLVAGLLFVAFWFVRSKSSTTKWIVYLSLSASIIYLGYALNIAKKKYSKVETLDLTNLQKKTKFGELYEHRLNNRLAENGHFIYVYIAPKELESTWGERSKLNYLGEDKKGQSLHSTLVRYLSSKGLKKDREGVLSLSDAEIADIENGKTSFYQGTKNAFDEKFDMLFFELNSFLDGGNPTGHSVAQRVEYVKTGLDIAKNNFLFGVGTGDVQDAFDKAYERSESELDFASRHRAHNQFLTFFITFGIFGFLYFIALLVFPFTINHLRNDFYFLSFYLIILLSFLNEDTLETQAGITLFTFFTCFFVLANRRQNQPKIS